MRTSTIVPLCDARTLFSSNRHRKDGFESRTRARAHTFPAPAKRPISRRAPPAVTLAVAESFLAQGAYATEASFLRCVPLSVSCSRQLHPATNLIRLQLAAHPRTWLVTSTPASPLLRSASCLPASSRARPAPCSSASTLQLQRSPMAAIAVLEWATFPAAVRISSLCD